MKRSNRPDSRVRAAVIARDTHCWLCGEPVDKTLSGMHPMGPTMDHIVPLSQGGATSLGNCRLAHRAHNTARGTKPIVPTTSHQW
jgi:5-methylcytosine-specific restriction endonuclease McrA